MGLLGVAFALEDAQSQCEFYDLKGIEYKTIFFTDDTGQDKIYFELVENDFINENVLNK